jgi:hypothetical protein
VPRTWPSLVRLSDRLPLAYHIAYSPCAPRPSPTPWPTDPESSAGALHQNSLAKLTVQGSGKERTATAREEKRRASEEQETAKSKRRPSLKRTRQAAAVAFSLVLSALWSGTRPRPRHRLLTLCPPALGQPAGPPPRQKSSRRCRKQAGVTDGVQHATDRVQHPVTAAAGPARICC